MPARKRVSARKVCAAAPFVWRHGAPQPTPAHTYRAVAVSSRVPSAGGVRVTSVGVQERSCAVGVGERRKTEGETRRHKAGERKREREREIKRVKESKRERERERSYVARRRWRQRQRRRAKESRRKTRRVKEGEGRAGDGERAELFLSSRVGAAIFPSS